MEVDLTPQEWALAEQRATFLKPWEEYDESYHPIAGISDHEAVTKIIQSAGAHLAAAKAFGSRRQFLRFTSWPGADRGRDLVFGKDKLIIDIKWNKYRGGHLFIRKSPKKLLEEDATHLLLVENGKCASRNGDAPTIEGLEFRYWVSSYRLIGWISVKQFIRRASHTNLFKNGRKKVWSVTPDLLRPPELLIAKAGVLGPPTDDFKPNA